jgi:molybdopterin-binding protein
LKGFEVGLGLPVTTRTERTGELLRSGRFPLPAARNRLRGIVTDVVRDGVMAQVEITTGPYRVVSLMSREAADQLELQVGVLAEAVIKSTDVVERHAAG